MLRRTMRFMIGQPVEAARVAALARTTGSGADRPAIAYFARSQNVGRPGISRFETVPLSFHPTRNNQVFGNQVINPK